MVSDTTEDSGTVSATRRRVMAAGGAAFASVAIAGCTGDGDENGAENGDENGAENGDENGDEESEALNYVVTDDLIAGSSGKSPATGFAQACSPTRQFMVGMQAVFKVGIWDPETGDPVDNDTIDEAVVEVEGESIELAPGEEGEEGEYEWSGSWIIPEDQEPGTVEYTVNVTNDGEYNNVGIFQGELVVIEGEDPRNYVVTNHVHPTSDSVPDDANGFASSCVPQHQYRPGMGIVFKVGIYDGTTGDPVGPDTIDGVSVDVDGYDTVELGTADPEEWDGEEWGGSWTIPEDAETGTVPYTVQVTAEGAFYDVGVAASEFEIIE